MAAKEENLSLLRWIQDEVKSSGTDQYFEFVFNVGEKSEFQIRIKGGELGNSVPDAMLENLADYEKLNIQLFEFPRVDPEALKPSNLEVPLPDGTVFKVQMDWRLAPSPIFPETDDRFSGQPWAKDWHLSKSTFAVTSTVCWLMASPDIVCDIIRHCYKLTGLKAFW
jgi:hypothetical protein